MIKPISEQRLFAKKPVRPQLKIRRKDYSGSQESMASASTATLKPSTSMKNLIKQYPKKPLTRVLIHCETMQKSIESASEWSGELSERERRQYQSMSKIAPVESSNLFERSSFADDDSVIHELAEILEAQESPPQRKRQPVKARRLPSSDKNRRNEGKGSLCHEEERHKPSLRLFVRNQKLDLQKKRTAPLSISKILSPQVTIRHRIAIDAGNGKTH